MGNTCPRRHTNMEQPQIAEEEEWLVIPIVIPEPEQPVAINPNRRFKNTVNKIKKLLILRKLFARAGSYLNTSGSRRAENARIRAVMSYIFTSWPRTVLRNTKPLFNHLRRERGQLVYNR